jgi:endoglucanase
MINFKQSLIIAVFILMLGTAQASSPAQPYTYNVDQYTAGGLRVIAAVGTIALVAGLLAVVLGAYKFRRRKYKITGALLLVAALFTFGYLAYVTSPHRNVPVVFSERHMLQNLWRAYKLEYLEPGTWRTMDKQRDFVTTSEGQSYTMLRAVWMDDKETFDQSWEWTKDNLGRQEDNLFAWLFGERADGTYGVLVNQGGYNTATDADVDIALALVFAYSRWQDPAYLEEAVQIINDIWRHEVVVIQGRPYLTASNLNTEVDKVLLNPSYFAPYAYRIFAEIDPNHNWLGVVDTSYDVLRRSMSLPLDRDRTAYLPPDWVKIDRRTGQLEASPNSDLSTNYGYDAMRVPWRLALDWQWNEEPRAKEVLSMFRLFNNEWRTKQALYSTYSHDGEGVMKYESPAMYGGSIGYFMVARNPRVAREVYMQKLQALYNPDTQSWRQTLSYYDDNLAWFGIALYHGALPNLYVDNFR